MKKISLIITIVAFAATAYGEAVNMDAAAFDIFKVVMNNSGKAEWANKNDYNKRLILFNGHEISVYYIAEYSLIGLSYRVHANDLPKEVLKAIKKKYSDCVIADALMFMDYDGEIKYYVLVRNSKRYTALKVSSTLKLRAMKKMPIK